MESAGSNVARQNMSTRDAIYPTVSRRKETANGWCVLASRQTQSVPTSKYRAAAASTAPFGNEVQAFCQN